jgi:hypothetical protein
MAPSRRGGQINVPEAVVRADSWRTAPTDNGEVKPPARLPPLVPELKAETDPDGVDYGWVMQTTFVVTILVGAPAVTVLSLFVSLPTWAARASFAVRVGAVVWLVTAIAVYLYARRGVTAATAE